MDHPPPPGRYDTGVKITYYADQIVPEWWSAWSDSFGRLHKTRLFSEY